MTEEKPIEHRYVFNGSAVAFGGRIRRPDNLFLKAAGVSHLPITGGLSESHVEGPDVSQYHYKEFLKFTEAHSRALGDFSDPERAVQFTYGNHGQNDLPVNSTVEARLLGLRIDAEAEHEKQTPRRVFQAQKLEIHMQTSSSRNAQATIRSLSTAFDGITLTTITQGTSSAVELKVSTATQIFCDHDTKSKLMEKYEKDGEFRKRYASCFHPLGDGDKGFIGNLLGKHEIPHADLGPIAATFVTKLEWVGVPPEGTEILNNRLTIHGLGRIYFGEIIISDGYQRASLLRCELGSPCGGEVTVGEAACEIGHIPPTRP